MFNDDVNDGTKYVFVINNVCTVYWYDKHEYYELLTNCVYKYVLCKVIVK